VVSGEPIEPPSQVGLTGYRIVQEALTNVARHAGPAAVTIRMTYGPELLILEVDNVSPSREALLHKGESAIRGSGMGIQGMTERAAALGGRLEAGRTADGGFRVRAELPLAGAPS
jgi:signal transduction histidine kinase